MIYIGIDLAWTNKRPSGLCILNDSGQILLWETALLQDEDIVGIIQKYDNGPLQIAIDAPLIVPNEMDHDHVIGFFENIEYTDMH